MFRAERKVAGHDARRGCRDPGLHRTVVGSDLDQLPAANVEENEPRLPASRQQPSTSCQPVQPELRRVRLDQPRVEGRVGLVVDKGRPAVELADAIDESADPRLADTKVELELDAKRGRGCICANTVP